MKQPQKLLPRSGTASNLTADQQKCYVELERLTLAEPELYVEQHTHESRRRRLLRHLRAWRFDVQVALQSVRYHSAVWKEIGMDHFTDEDELRESDVMFACGEDLWGRTVVVCRPAALVTMDGEDAIKIARRCAWTFHRAIQRLSYGVEQVVVLCDLEGASRQNMDGIFFQEVVRCNGSLFPDRMASCTLVNVHWTMMVFWQAAQNFLSQKTREKTRCYGTDPAKALGAVLPNDHPYLQYLLAVKGLSDTDRLAVPLPRATPFVPRWHEALEADRSTTSEVVRQETPRQRVTDLLSVFLRSFACCGERDQVNTVSAVSLQAEKQGPVCSLPQDQLVTSSVKLRAGKQQPVWPMPSSRGRGKTRDSQPWWPRGLRICRCPKREPGASQTSSVYRMLAFQSVSYEALGS
jgi:hypothetical protein